MIIQTYTFRGYQNFESLEENLAAIFRVALGTRATAYRIAVGEAVCNAARYALVGFFDAEVTIQLIITKNEINTIVLSKTKPFNALSYRQQLQDLAANPNIGPALWSQYTGTSGMSRGFWLMLQACSRIVVERTGDFIELAAPITAIPPENGWQRKVNALVPRFYVKFNGVIR